MSSNIDNIKVEISAVSGRSVIPMTKFCAWAVRGHRVDFHQDHPVVVLTNEKLVAKGEIEIQGEKIVSTRNCQ